MKETKDILNHEPLAQGLSLFSKSIEPMLKKLLGPNGFANIDIVKNWKSIAGEELGAHTLPQKIEFTKDKRTDGTLYLMTSSGAYALEIQHKANIIIEKINTYFGYRAVQKIKIIQNQSDVFDLDENGVNIADIEKKKLVTQDEQNYIDSITQDITDEQLKVRLERLARAIIISQKKEN